jgi:hypothetical protein
MGTISQNDLKKVFSAVDARLKKKLDVYLIGGASAILGYNVSKETNDVMPGFSTLPAKCIYKPDAEAAWHPRE